MINLMSLLPSGGGGKLKWQVFNTSGTFTPTPEHLAAGGVVRVILVPGGGGGFSGGTYNAGHAGIPVDVMETVSGPVSVTVGAGGAPLSQGGATSFGSVSAPGGLPNGVPGTGGFGAGNINSSVFGGVGVILPIIGPCCGGGQRAAEGAQGRGPSVQYGGASDVVPAAPNRGGGGSGVTANATGGSGCCVVIWEE